MDILRERLSGLSGGRILDVGTGFGEFINILVKYIKDYSEIIGVDLDESKERVFKEKLNQENIKFFVMNAEKMDYGDNSFDTVCISNSLHHLPDDKQFAILSEMKRVLKPGGCFIINEMFCDDQDNQQLSHVFFHHWSAKIHMLLRKYHNKTYKKKDILDIAEKLHLRGMDIFEYRSTEAATIEEVNELIIQCDDIVERIKGFPEYEKLKREGEEVKGWLRKNGFAGAGELLILGEK